MFISRPVTSLGTERMASRDALASAVPTISDAGFYGRSSAVVCGRERALTATACRLGDRDYAFDPPACAAILRVTRTSCLLSRWAASWLAGCSTTVVIRPKV